MSRSLAVLVICRHRLVGEALSLALQQDDEFDPAAAVVDHPAAVAVNSLRRADVVTVIGWEWQEDECMELLTRLHAERPASPVLVVSAEVGPTHVQRALQSGAKGFLPADVDVDDLIHAVRTAARGEETVLHRTLVPALLAYLATGTSPDACGGAYETLTPREREVVRLLTQGLGDRDLAQSLFLSVRTVQTHLSHIYAKLGVHTRTEVALMAVREGWVSLGSGERVQA